MNREDRSKFLALIEEKNPALLDGIDQASVDDTAIMLLVEKAMSAPAAHLPAVRGTTGPQLTQTELQALLEHHGLTYRTSERVTEPRPDGTTRRVWQPIRRPMQASDVLSHRVNGTHVVVVTADGQKRTLARMKVEG
jgi:hypothetical protein